jgi:hypothetical protein
MPSSNAASLIDSAKVVLNIASASVAALRKQLPVLAVPAPLEKKETLSRVATKVPPLLDVNKVTTSAQDLLVYEENADITDNESKIFTS